MRIGSVIIFHLSELRKAKFFILCDVIFWWGRGNFLGVKGIMHIWLEHSPTLAAFTGGSPFPSPVPSPLEIVLFSQCILTACVGKNLASPRTSQGRHENTTPWRATDYRRNCEMPNSACGLICPCFHRVLVIPETVETEKKRLRFHVSPNWSTVSKTSKLSGTTNTNSMFIFIPSWADAWL